MSSFTRQFATDPNLEAGTGIPLDYGEAGTVFIHRAGGANKKYARVSAVKMKPYARQLDAGNLDEDTKRRVLLEIYADSVIIGWEGVTDDDGKPIEFNRQNVITVFSEVPDVFDHMLLQAERAANFRRQEIEDTAKNLSSGSASTSKSGRKKPD